MEVKTNTYQRFLEDSYNTLVLTSEEQALDIFKRFQGNQSSYSKYDCISFLLNYSTRKYLFVDQSCFDLLGYKASYFLEKGLDGYLIKWHPADYKIINERVFPDNLEFLSTIPPDQHLNYIFSHNYRVLNSQGTYVNVIQRFSFIPGPTGTKPAGVIGIVFDITHFKNDQTIVHTIEYSSADNDISLVFKNIHTVYDLPIKEMMTERETGILKLLAEGLNSKEIASRIRLSVHTINNHRKNMLYKSSCSNTGELISLAISQGII